MAQLCRNFEDCSVALQQFRETRALFETLHVRVSKAFCGCYSGGFN